MKLIKINTDHYIIVDDSEIKEGDFVYVTLKPSICQFKEEMGKEWCKKITHSTQPLNTKFNDWFDVQIITLQEVKELFGEVDVEKKASELTNHLAFPEERKEGIILGYNQALEDNKDKKYTEEDLRNAILTGMKTGFHPEYHIESANRIIQFIELKTEWEVEMVDGKLKLM